MLELGVLMREMCEQTISQNMKRAFEYTYLYSFVSLEVFASLLYYKFASVLKQRYMYSNACVHLNDIFIHSCR